MFYANQLGKLTSGLRASDRRHRLMHIGQMTFCNDRQQHPRSIWISRGVCASTRQHRSWPVYIQGIIYEWHYFIQCMHTSVVVCEQRLGKIDHGLHALASWHHRTACRINKGFTHLMCFLTIEKMTLDDVKKHHPRHGCITGGVCSRLSDIDFSHGRQHQPRLFIYGKTMSANDRQYQSRHAHILLDVCACRKWCWLMECSISEVMHALVIDCVHRLGHICTCQLRVASTMTCTIWTSDFGQRQGSS